MRAALARLRVPQPLDVLLGEDHRGVEPDDREAAGDVEDRLDHRLADVGLQEVELGRVVPREARPVVAVVEVARLAGPAVDAARRRPPHRCRPSSGPRSGSRRAGRRRGRGRRTVGRVGRLGELDEPLRMLDHPPRVDPHVVRDHVAGQPDPVPPGPVAELGSGRPRRRGRRRSVVVERVRRRDRVGVAAPALDPLRRPRPLPQADQPEAGDPEPRDPASSSSGIASRVRIVAAVPPRELVEPDVVLFASRTSRGIQSRSSENRSGSASAPEKAGASPAAAPPAPPNRRWSPAAPRPGRRSRRRGGRASRSRAAPSSQPQCSRT